jgi:hypothetical protein
VTQETRVLTEGQETRVLLEIMRSVSTQDPREEQVQLGQCSQVRQVQWLLQEIQDRLAKGLADPWVPRGPLATRVPQAIQVVQDPRGCNTLEIQVPQAIPPDPLEVQDQDPIPADWLHLRVSREDTDCCIVNNSRFPTRKLFGEWNTLVPVYRVSLSNFWRYITRKTLMIADTGGLTQHYRRV